MGLSLLNAKRKGRGASHTALPAFCDCFVTCCLNPYLCKLFLVAVSCCLSLTYEIQDFIQHTTTNVMCKKGGHQYEQNRTPYFHHFFSYLKFSFPPYRMYVRCLEQDVSPAWLSTGAVDCIISTSVSVVWQVPRVKANVSYATWKSLKLPALGESVTPWLCVLSCSQSNPSSMAQCFTEGWHLKPKGSHAQMEVRTCEETAC